MRTAFSLWNERIAPVFDVARHLWIVDAENGRIIGQTGRRFSSDDPQERALRLTTMQVEQLVCGAITRSSYEALSKRGIQVVSFIAGDLDQVVHACLADQLKDGKLNMPGCHRVSGTAHGAIPVEDSASRHQNLQGSINHAKQKWTRTNGCWLRSRTWTRFV